MSHLGLKLQNLIKITIVYANPPNQLVNYERLHMNVFKQEKELILLP